MSNFKNLLEFIVNVIISVGKFTSHQKVKIKNHKCKRKQKVLSNVSE